MGTWNHRIVLFDAQQGPYYTIQEVYYGNAGDPISCCDTSIGGETIPELVRDFGRIVSALIKEPLKFPDDFSVNAVDYDANQQYPRLLTNKFQRILNGVHSTPFSVERLAEKLAAVVTTPEQKDSLEFVEVRFPSDISYGSVGGPDYNETVIIGGPSGRRFNVSTGVKTQAQLDALISFFRARKGRKCGFRYKDWTDFRVNDGEIGQGDGVSRDFQLIKKYDDEVFHIVTKPVSGTVEVYVDGIAVPKDQYQVDHIVGIVSFNHAPAPSCKITASFEYDVPVRFDTDRISAGLDVYGANTWHDIPVIEIDPLSAKPL